MQNIELNMTLKKLMKKIGSTETEVRLALQSARRQYERDLFD